MKLTIFAAMAAVAAAQIDLDDSSVALEERWEAFKTQFGKTYSVDEEESAFRAFRQNDAKIQKFNARGETYTLGHNEWSDMTSEEFNSVMLGGYQEDAREKNYDYTLADRAQDAPDAKDWVTLGAVTPIKNQGQCGSCWAFSTTGSMESANAIAGNDMTLLSEQQFVDCDTKQDQGCNGGLMDSAFEYAKTNPVMLESDYKYIARRTLLPWNKKCGDAKTKGVVSVSSYSDVTPKSATQLKAAVAKGPVSVAIEADKMAFQGYSGGVITGSSCGTQLDHGVLAVGYGTEDGKDYFLVKNSWGPTWGDKGYVKIGQDGVCGITYQPSWPTTN